VLTRIAESLYWFGRYVERAEDTARILDVHYHLLLEDPDVDEEAACRALLEVMGVAAQPDSVSLDADGVTRLLAYDPTYGGSIVGAITAAWENARGAREAVSAETWRCVNATYNALPDAREMAEGHSPHTFFDWIKERSAILVGLAESTMSRDDGWRFLVLGRSIERVDMTTRLLSARHREGWGTAGWITTLRCCSAHEAYLRTYQQAVDASLAAEFLLLDRLFPRSLFHALSTAEQCLAQLDPRSGRTGLEDEARRTLGRARTGLEFGGRDELLAHLPERLTEIQMLCGRAARAVASRYFGQTQQVAWSRP
jgi:uncharacterized alpha-E superfamily protein